jgi:membrane protease YdiL (CAAX protease family)
MTVPAGRPTAGRLSARAGRLQGATRRKAVLTIHIAAAVALLGTSSGLLIAAAYAATRGDPRQAHTLYELMRLSTYSLGIPFSFIALGAGAFLGRTSKWGIVRYWWVLSKLALLLATIAFGALLTGPSIDTALEETAPGGAGGGEARWTLVGAVAAQIALVLSATVLAVFKPGGPRRRRRNRSRKER